MMAQCPEEVMAMIAALSQGITTQDETNAEIQRPSGASTTLPILGS